MGMKRFGNQKFATKALCLMVWSSLTWAEDGAKKEQKAKADTSPSSAQADDPELKKVRGELGLISARNRLREEKQKSQLAETEMKAQNLALRNRMAAEQQKSKDLSLAAELRKLQAKKRRLDLANALKKAELETLSIKSKSKHLQMEIEEKERNFEKSKRAFEEQKLDSSLRKIERETKVLESQERLTRRVKAEAKYLTKPLVNGVLHLSDRRIPLNGPIIRGVGKKIADRIDFFNNRSATQPIFIVINSSPGGSVMEGFLILKAMQGSKAPVHVVVKSYAASMAAAVLTMADESYTLPDAVILHHEMSTFLWGNMTELKERLKESERWEKRLVGPLAKKIGYRSIEAMRKALYKNNSNGDWRQFGDEAKKSKWVKHVVSEIRETGILQHPEDVEAIRAKRPPILGFGPRRDPQTGKIFHELPPLEAFDHYFLYNPHGYYRIL